MIDLQDWAAARRARGGAGIKVRLVKGANLPMERVDASVHGWPLATWATKQDTDTNYKRVLDYALHPDAHRERADRGGRAQPVRHRVRLAAGRAALRSATGSSSRCCSAWRRPRRQAVRRDVGGLLLYTPVVHPGEFDAAIAYLVRRLEEGASSDNFMSALFELHHRRVAVRAGADRFLASLDGARRGRFRRRTRVRTGCTEVAGVMQTAFANTPDTDPSLPANRAWGARSSAGCRPATSGATWSRGRPSPPPTCSSADRGAVAAGAAWGARSGRRAGRGPAPGRRRARAAAGPT